MYRADYPCHNRDEEEEETLPMAVHVLFGKFNANSEYANSDHNTSELEGNIINALVGVISPRAGIEDVCSMWT